MGSLTAQFSALRYYWHLSMKNEKLPENNPEELQREDMTKRMGLLLVWAQSVKTIADQIETELGGAGIPVIKEYKLASYKLALDLSMNAQILRKALGSTEVYSGG